MVPLAKKTFTEEVIFEVGLSWALTQLRKQGIIMCVTSTSSLISVQ